MNKGLRYGVRSFEFFFFLGRVADSQFVIIVIMRLFLGLQC